MTYQKLSTSFSRREGVAESTMMGSPCLRYKGEFIAMMFAREESLIVKLASERVNEIIASGDGNAFTFTKKRFNKWVLIPIEFEHKYADYLEQALQYAKQNTA